MSKENAEFNISVVNEWFFPAPVYTFSEEHQRMVIVPAPQEATSWYGEVIETWLNKYVGLGTPHVSIYPVTSLEQEGYKVQAEVWSK